MALIEKARVRKILDSRGDATVEVDIITSKGLGRASAPSGASTGKYEALAYPEEGIDAAIEKFDKEVGPKLLGFEVTAQKEIDKILHEIDGTSNFSSLGGNVAVATSLAVAKAAANSLGLPLYRYIGGAFSMKLPFPLGNVIGGGKHAIGGTDVQEYLSIALGPSIHQSIFANARIHKRVKEKLKRKFPKEAIGKGDEGAWVAKMSNEDAMNILEEACSEISKEVGFDCKPSLDMAASELYRGGKYHYKEGSLSPEKQIEFVADLVDEYKLYVVEDPLHEDDFEGYSRLTELVGNRCLIVGDDLFVTNVERLRKGINMGAANAILIKPNQIGTLSDAFETVNLAHQKGYKCIISHRSGETTDESIAHLSIAFGCYAIKTGAVGGERLAKLNELMRIEEEFKGG